MAVTGMIAVFIVGYVFIALEHKIKINKSATALLMSGVLWTIFILSAHRFGLTVEQVNADIATGLESACEILVYLIGAMTIVDLIDLHGGFNFITRKITTRNKVNKVFKWLKKMGGLSAMKERNENKARILYDFLDSSSLFKGTVVPADRSLMNVPFVTGNKDLDAKFVKEAQEAGLENLKGHRTVGGMRASIYNAMPVEGVEALVNFMKNFEKENG